MKIENTQADTGAWIGERVRLHASEEARANWTLRSKAYSDYVQWARHNGTKPASPSIFKVDLKARGVRVLRSNGETKCSLSIVLPWMKPDNKGVRVLDSVGLWLAHNASVLWHGTPRAEWTRRSGAYRHYAEWAASQGHAAMSSVNFSRRLTQEGVVIVKSGGHHIIAVRMATGCGVHG